MSLSIEIKGLKEELEANFRNIIREELERALKPDTVTRSQIAKELGRSREWLSRSPWVLPNYGRPDVGGGICQDSCRLNQTHHARFLRGQPAS